MLYLGLGTNIGDRLHNLQTARELINRQMGKIIIESSIYETAAWGLTNQGAFLNQAIAVKTRRSPDNLLKILLQIEKQMGRIREIKWGPRIIDIDILYYGNQIIETADLTIPHPFIQERKFVLAPLTEIAPDYIHPKNKKTNLVLLNECSDESEIQKIAEG
ncbi:MAG: 2-amino-4-hydroxy-6-hydroxymethyldihydropteridine diphosphokinase [Spirosomaceae bacterium]|jgi:2-amino-4-hydroxy-6-hydroxymethyldihydropteridine diphosphokinase|nr:2-amino-4-hydroxy-6-hydroxymethyldihydropteridine diphosphokinase [Spirosomataceae bacterium]